MIKSRSMLDMALGIEYYSRPEVFLGAGVRAELSPSSFKVYEEVYGLGVAVAPERPPDEVKCSKERKVLAIMCKTGISTLDVEWLLREVGVKLEYWGIKDARAETCQFVTLRCLRDAVIPADMVKGVKIYALKSVNTGFTPKRHQLAGNLFEVLLTCTGSSPERIVSTIELSAGLSYLNYFGYQRFGTVRPITHAIGRAIAVGDYDSALSYLVGYSSDAESPDVRTARKLFTEGYYRDSLRSFPKSFVIERSVLKKYIETGNSREAVTKGLPRNLLRFFVESYQSYLFNKALSVLAATAGSIEDVEKRCEVLELPRPGISPQGCSKYSHESIAEDLGTRLEVVNKALFTKSVRESVFRVSDPRVTILTDGVVRLSFKLGRGSYATVYLRELLRDNLVI
ncbi:MAG: tRNA pseudouridine(13) synthase TruD [Sulfolobales archaeon]